MDGMDCARISTRESAAAVSPDVKSVDWYDLPRLYDIVFDVGTREEAAFLVTAHAKYGRSRGRRALEPACGSGRLVAALARRGWKVSGFDRNENMLAHARERLARHGLRARLVQADMESFELAGSFDLAHCLVSTFKYLLDERSARAHLERVAAALAPGGVYVLGLHYTDYETNEGAHELWNERRGATRVRCDTRVGPADRRKRLEPVRTLLTARTPAGTRRYETRWDFRTYDARELARLVASVPALEVAAVHDFDYAIERPGAIDDERLDKVFVLRRR
jgi:SAM-dependent methyltransferase